MCMLELRRVECDDWKLWREVRLAALRDAPYAFGSTLAEWTDQGDTQSRWRDRLEAVPLNLVAIADGTAVGQASGTPIREDGRVEVISMWVAPTSRGQGIGIALLDEIATWAREQGASAILLSVKPT